MGAFARRGCRPRIQRLGDRKKVPAHRKAFQVGGTGTTGEADTDLVSIGLLARF
jgi:hypothetical protein